MGVNLLPEVDQKGGCPQIHILFIVSLVQFVQLGLDLVPSTKSTSPQ